MKHKIKDKRNVFFKQYGDKNKKLKIKLQEKNVIRKENEKVISFLKKQTVVKEIEIEPFNFRFTGKGSVEASPFRAGRKRDKKYKKYLTKEKKFDKMVG